MQPGIACICELAFVQPFLFQGILQFRADCERYLESIPEEKREMERKILKIGGKENGTKPRRRKRTLSANPTLLNEGEAEPERKVSWLILLKLHHSPVDLADAELEL